jgi:cell fate (sporulation/competence/biofilm development) regulator YlbF (YheA/YmcA/DUF963 family)
MKLHMQTEDTPVIQKTKELCQTILGQPAYHALRKAIDAFLGDPASVEQYRTLCDLQDTLGGKQEQGQQLSAAEIEAFEKAEQEFLANPAAQGFIDAQRQMQKIEQTVSQYVRKTFELGRLPQEDDLGGGGCGSGSGCGSGCSCH